MNYLFIELMIFKTIYFNEIIILNIQNFDGETQTNKNADFFQFFEMKVSYIKHRIKLKFQIYRFMNINY